MRLFENDQDSAQKRLFFKNNAEMRSGKSTMQKDIVFENGDFLLTAKQERNQKRNEEQETR
jgi:hypothetical protein